MKCDFQDNTTLVHHLRNGNKTAYNFLIDKFNHKLCVYANSLINDYILAEDIVQNVFIKLWERRQHIRVDFPIQNFLYKSVYNEFIDQYRKQHSTMKLEKKYFEALDIIVEENMEDSIEKLIKIVIKEIQYLPPKCKQTFLLSKKDGLSNIEISEYLGISIKTVESQITKAYKIIRSKVGKKEQHILLLICSNNLF